MGRMWVGAAAGGIFCSLIGLYAGLGLGWASGMEALQIAILAAVLGGVLGLAGAAAGGTAGRSGARLPFLRERGWQPPDGPEADYHDPADHP